MSTTRRLFLKQGGLTLVASAGLWTSPASAQSSCRRVSGAGSYRLGPFEHAQIEGREVFLLTDLGFDETWVRCKITTNFEPLLFPTAGLGVIPFGPHEFFMEMESTRIDALEIQVGSDGPLAIYTGTLRSETRIGSGENARTFIEEDVDFGCAAVDLGPAASVEVSTINFSMTVRYHPSREHALIFGQRPTFAGHLISGNIIVVP